MASRLSSSSARAALAAGADGVMLEVHTDPGAALSDGRVYAAGFDVFEREPVPQDNELLSHSNVVVAPHIGSATSLTRARMADIAADNAIAALKGQRMGHCVNPQVYD